MSSRSSLGVALAFAGAAVGLGLAVSGCWGVGRFQVVTVTYVDGEPRTVLVDTTLGEARVLAPSNSRRAVIWTQPVPRWSELPADDR